MAALLQTARRVPAFSSAVSPTVLRKGGKIGFYLQNDIPLRTGVLWKRHHAFPSSRVRISPSFSTKPSASAATEKETKTASNVIKADSQVVPSGNSQLTLLYDGDCPLCMKEVRMLRRRSDERGGRLTFVDIADNDFDETSYGVNYEMAMGRIHAVRRDGDVISGVRVFREAYEAVGLGWVYALTKFPPVLWFVERVYDVWAARRLQFTGRDTLDAIIQARNSKRSCR